MLEGGKLEPSSQLGGMGYGFGNDRNGEIFDTIDDGNGGGTVRGGGRFVDAFHKWKKYQIKYHYSSES